VPVLSHNAQEFAIGLAQAYAQLVILGSDDTAVVA